MIDQFFNQMAEALAQWDRVEIRGLCSFFVKKYKAYTGRNPKPGEKVEIKPRKLPFFKVGQGAQGTDGSLRLDKLYFN